MILEHNIRYVLLPMRIEVASKKKLVSEEALVLKLIKQKL